MCLLSKTECIHNVHTRVHRMYIICILSIFCTRNKQINQRINIKRTFVSAVFATAVSLVPFFPADPIVNVLNSKSHSFRSHALFTCIFIFLKGDEQYEMVMNEFIFTYGDSSECVPRSTMANVWHWVRAEEKNENILISQTQIIPFPYLFLSKQCASIAPTPFCNIYVCFHTIPHFKYYSSIPLFRTLCTVSPFNGIHK